MTNITTYVEVERAFWHRPTARATIFSGVNPPTGDDFGGFSEFYEPLYRRIAATTPGPNPHWGYIVLTKQHSRDEGEFWLPDWDGQIHIDHDQAQAAEQAAVLALGRESVVLIKAVAS